MDDSGRASGPPRIGRAIIATTLLLKGDALALLDQPSQDQGHEEGARVVRVDIGTVKANFGSQQASIPVAGSLGAITSPAGGKVQRPLVHPATGLGQLHRSSGANLAISVTAAPEITQPPLTRAPLFDGGPADQGHASIVSASEAVLPLVGSAADTIPKPAPAITEAPSAPSNASMPTALPGATSAINGVQAAAVELQVQLDPVGVKPTVLTVLNDIPARTAELPSPVGAPVAVSPQATPQDQAANPAQLANLLPKPAFGPASQPAEASDQASKPVAANAESSRSPQLALIEKPEAPPSAAAGQASAPGPVAEPDQPQPEAGALPKPAFGLNTALRDNHNTRVLPPRRSGASREIAPQAAVPTSTSQITTTAANDNGASAASRLPEPEFGKSVRQTAPAILASAPAPTMLAVAAVPGSQSLPQQPETEAASPATGHNAPVQLAASRSLAGLPGAGRSPALPQVRIAPASARFADTSPRLPGDPAPNFSIDDELILQLQSARGEIADTITAYGTRAAVYLPLGAVARFLDLAISVSDEGHYASGWFIDEKQTMSVNLRQGRLVVGQKDMALQPGDAAAFEGELYLRAERFSDIFPLNLIVDLRAQTVVTKTLVPFPFEQRMARDDQRSLIDSAARREAARWPRENTPWRALAFPLAELELRGVSDSTYGHRAEGDLRVAGDLAFMTARAFVSATSRDGLTGAHVELGRRDPEARLLGPLKATEFQIGDITTAALPLGLREISGRGATLTNAPLERASVFDTIDLDGDLPQGYEVELYRNNVLIGSTRLPVNGQYQFFKVSVDYGLNVFRLVFFGPQGQRREEVRRLSVGDGRLGKGELVYVLGGAQKEVNLFNARGPGFRPGLDYGTWRGSALLEYGVSRHLTASLGGAWFESRFGRQWMATGGLRTGFGGTALKLDLGYQSNGGKAALLGLGGRIGGVSYTLTHAEYSGGFTDEVRSFSADPLRRASELNVNTAIRLRGGDQPLLLPLYGQLRRVEFSNGKKQIDATLRGSLPLRGLMLSNTLSYASNKIPGSSSSSQLRGTFDLATLNGSRLQLRTSADYGVVPQLKLEGVSLEASYALDERTLIRASAGYTLDDSRTLLGLSAVRRLGKFNLAFDGSFSVVDSTYSAALRLGFSFGRNPLNGKLFFSEPGLTSGGAIAARAFRDSNGNRQFDSGEDPLPDVDFYSGSRRGKSDAQGLVLLGNLGDGNRASMTIGRDSLPDISLAPVSEGVDIIPRAGRVHVTGFAVQELSEIEGTAFFSDGGNLGREVSGLRLNLTDGEGKTVARVRTGGDGSYFFEQIPPGIYAIQIDPSQATSLKIRLTEPISITIGPNGGYLKQLIRVSAN